MKHQGVGLHIVFTLTLTVMTLAILSILYPLSGNPVFVYTTRYYSPPPELSSSSLDDKEQVYVKDPPPPPPPYLELSSSSDDQEQVSVKDLNGSEKCDLFSGEWVPNPEAPYYTNTTCRAIHEHQNCMKYGRPDADFLKWRWKPGACELPIFNPAQFLEIVRGKSMAFVGDSLSRNQVQSLICLLSRVEYPIDVSYARNERFKRWRYTNYNFTVATFWAPYLVKCEEVDPNGTNQKGIFNLYLDEFDEEWTNQIDEFDYIIISAGQWFFRPMVYYENNKIVGCRYGLLKNVTDMPISYGYRKAFRTAFKAINGLENYKGMTFLRTFSPSHFENGKWNEGGNCVRTKPFKSNETAFEGENLELYMIQKEEFMIAEKEGQRRGKKFRLLDTTQATFLRPDGHPNRYGHWAHESVELNNDCVHWCLPGPIDSWNDFLQQMLIIR